MSFASLQVLLTPASQWLMFAAPYLAAAACVFSLLALLLIFLQRRRLSKLMRGRSGSMEEILRLLSRDTKELKEFRSELEKYLKLAEMRLRKSVRGVGVVRFNPFESGAGGNQSFATAFLDEEGSGVVFSTLYARDRVGVYAKPVEQGSSTFELTTEEKDAIAKARAATQYKK